MDHSLENWIMQHIASPARELYFQLNGDIPVEKGKMTVLIDIPRNGRMVCVIHPDLMTPVAHICYRQGVKMVQVG
jgi:hypothetical protein